LHFATIDLEGKFLTNHRNPWIDIKKLRLKKGWTQNEAAEKLGCTRSHLSTVENGKRGFSKKMMYAITIIFDVNYEDFYTGTE